MTRLPFVLLLVAALVASEGLANEDDQEVRRLVAELGHEDAAVREEASRTLVFYRDQGVGPLQQALESADVEVRERARLALDAIELDRRIGPSAWVRLPEGEASIEVLLREVARQAGRSFDRGDVVLEGKRYNGPSGWMPIWQGIDALTSAAGCFYKWPFDAHISLVAGSSLRRPLVHGGGMRIEIVGLEGAPAVVVDTGLDIPRPRRLLFTVRWEPHLRPMVDAHAWGLDLADAQGRPQISRVGQYAMWFAGLEHDADDDCGPIHSLPVHILVSPVSAVEDTHAHLRGALSVLHVLDYSEVRDDGAVREHGRGFYTVSFTVSARSPRPEGLTPADSVSVGPFTTHFVESADGRRCPMEFLIASGGLATQNYAYEVTPVGNPPYTLVERTPTRVITQAIVVDFPDLDLR